MRFVDSSPVNDLDFGAVNSPRVRAEPVSRGVYVLLALVFGGIGVHNLYARRTTAAIAQFVIFTVGIVLALTDTIPGGVVPWGMGSTISGWLALWMFFDVFCVQEDGNGKLMR
jgi:hypothetical protein